MEKGHPGAQPRASRRPSVEARLALLAIGPVAFAAALFGAASAWRETVREASAEEARLTAAAAALASVSADAVAAGDRARGLGAARSIQAQPGIAHARIERADGSLFVEAGERVGRAENLVPRLSLDHTHSASAPIQAGGRTLGRVTLIGRDHGLVPLVLASLGLGLGAGLTAAAIGLLAARRLKKALVRPILARLRSMTGTAAAPGRGVDDEFGDLAEAFDHMMGEIRVRDAQLAERAAGLERELAARTAELREARAARAAASELAAAKGPPRPSTRFSSRLSSERRALLEDLHAAIATDGLSLVYQPQFDRGGAIQGVEALVRWTHTARGAVEPSDFIPLMEKHGRIERLTDWVIRRAMAETADLAGLKVSFNASALEFADAKIVQRTAALAEAAGFDLRRLEVEITETAILAGEEQVRANMSALRELGMTVALDDFGAGYSSLGHLRRYPFDKLKIDRGFVVDCTRDVQSATVVHAVVSIGRALGMRVVAEGVETEQQRQFLKIAGVHAVQGFLFGRPAPIEALRDQLARPPPDRRLGG